MVEQLKDVLVRAGASWVIWILVGLSVLSIAVMLDRARAFWAQRDDVTTLVQELHRPLGAGDVDGVSLRLEESPSTAAAIARAGLAQWRRGADAAREAMPAALVGAAAAVFGCDHSPPKGIPHGPPPEKGGVADACDEERVETGDAASDAEAGLSDSGDTE